MGRQSGEVHAIGKLVCEASGNSTRKARLANPAGAHQRDCPCPRQKISDFLNHVLAAVQFTHLCGQIPDDAPWHTRIPAVCAAVVSCARVKWPAN